VNLPDILLTDNPLRPWALATVASLIACVPPGSRRVGAVLLAVVVISFAISFSLTNIFASFSPTP